jgi:hypothetical protein
MEHRSLLRFHHLVLAFALPWVFACAGAENETKPNELKPVALPPELAGLAIRVRDDGTGIGREAATALGTELARAGMTVLTDAQRPSDLDLRLAVDVHNIGIAVEGVATLTAESGGVLLDRLSTPLDVYRRGTFATSVSRQLADLLGKSARVRAFAAGRHGNPEAAAAAPASAKSPVTDASTVEPPPATAPQQSPSPTAPVVALPPSPPPPPAPAQPSPSAVTPAPPAPSAATPAPSPKPPSPAPPPVSQPASPAPSASPTVAPSPPALEKSGRFGLGLALEVDLGWAEAVTSQISVAGAVVALALQFDLGPRAAFRLPLSFAFGGSGNDLFGQLALSPSVIYRFRDHVDQEWIPYIGLGLRLGSGLGGRHLLGRPVRPAGVTGPDSCPDSLEHPRDRSQPVPDCTMFISPEPIVGVEWHASRLFSLDLAASYSFAHFSSSEGMPRWLSLFQLYLGPRISF